MIDQPKRCLQSRWRRPILVLAIALSIATRASAADHYLFSYFIGNGEDGLHLAHSTDGLNWQALNRGQSLLRPTVDKDRLMRDPSVVRGPDGHFHMVWTTGWHDHGIGVAHSSDLIEWSEQKRIGVMDHEPKCRNCWAPEIFYDDATQQYLIFWASTIEERFPETAGSCESDLNHRIYYVTTKDFQTYSPTQLYFDPGIAIIDSFLVRDGDRYVLVTKNETRFPEPAKNLFVATAAAATGPFHVQGAAFSPNWVEGPSVLHVGDRWLIYFDEYTRHHYKAMQTHDFDKWSDVETPLTYPTGMRHGTAFTVDEAVATKLLELQPPALPNGSFEETHKSGDNDQRVPLHWLPHVYGGDAELALVPEGRNKSQCVSVRSPSGTDASWRSSFAVDPQSRYRLTGWIRTQDVDAGSGRGALLNVHELSGATTQVIVGTTDWRRVEVIFDTGTLDQITVNTLLGGWGTSSGTAWFDDLQLERLGNSPEPSVWPAPSGNPIIADCIADPSIAEFDGVFYLTATTDDCPRDGFGRWHNGPAVLWKSTDLVHWSFQGHLMPSANDMLFWAPSRIIQHNDRYLLFPTLNSKIRVAAAESPDGPFELIAGTKEKPLLDTIDAEVFVDDDGQGYLFSNHRRAWRMNNDLTAVVGDPITIETRRQGYSEGPIVFKRQGIYYYLYTLSGHEDYHYAYCLSRQSPLGPFETPAEDIVARSDPEQGIFGPGHGNVFSPAGTDDYYFVYLEFGRGGVTRQVCINRLEFNDDGTIRPVQVSPAGITGLRRDTDNVAAAQLRDLVRQDQVSVAASSQRPPITIYGYADKQRLLRREDYMPDNVTDQSNFTRWLPAEDDTDPWFSIDLGKVQTVVRTEFFLYRPTLGHAYQIESSTDGQHWTSVVNHTERQIRSPQIDTIDVTTRYLRMKFLEGHPGIWEMNIYGKSTGR